MNIKNMVGWVMVTLLAGSSAWAAKPEPTATLRAEAKGQGVVFKRGHAETSHAGKADGAAAKRDLLAEYRNGAMAGVEDIVFAERGMSGDGHWYANFGYFAEDHGESPEGDSRKLYTGGGFLCRLNLTTGKRTVLLQDPRGGIRDPQVSYDGTRILFAYKKGGTANYHLYEIAVDGTGLRALTDGPWDDIEPTYLADGGIAFVSSRCKRWVNCWRTQVAVLYRCDGDGGNMRPLSSNIEQDNTPWPLPDGRIIYTRWEYVDRRQVDYHHLWTANPDGTHQTVFYGNLNPGGLMIDAKPIPGTHKVVASFSPGHGQQEHMGAVTVVDPEAGPDEPASARRVSRTENFRDPWAFSEDCFLAVEGNTTLVLMNGRGDTHVLYRLPAAEANSGYWLHEPRPLMPRPAEARTASSVRLGLATGHMMLADVCQGRRMNGVMPGEVRKLLVLETLPKPINFSPAWEPISFGGSFTLERILGTVPVEKDGSAYFEVPALRGLFFVALDKNDMAVKRMQSFTTVQPGETLGCVGCHEARTAASRRDTLPLAVSRPPSRIEPVAGEPDIFDYPRDIQPVLDALCVKCHGYEKTAAGGPRAGRLILTGDRGPMFSHSYYMMTLARLFSDGRNLAQSNYEPYTLGSSASRILKMLDGSHHGVRATDAQKRRLRLWIETGAPYPGTYAALGTGMIGDFALGDRLGPDGDWPVTRDAAKAINRRCAVCHSGRPRQLPLALSDEHGAAFWKRAANDRRLNTSRHIVFNLTRPEKSAILLAPLATAAGGWGLCRNPDTGVDVFASIADPDYRKLLALCVAGKEQLEKVRRFDMPGFGPRVEYLREMKRYGVLSATFDLARDAADPYALDRRYWESLWWQPALKQVHDQ